jgi:hypothetical protein
MSLKPANSIEDTMEALGLGRQKLYDEINSGRLRTFHVGRRRFASDEAIREYVRDREAEATQGAA